MKALRILLVTETYPPEINGVAMTTQHLVQGLRARGHWVGIVRPRQNDEAHADPCTWLVPGVPIPHYQGVRLGLPVWFRMKRLIDEQQPDLVHVTTEGPLGWAALMASRARGLPVTSGYHTHFDQYSSHYGMNWMRPWVTGWLDAFHQRCQATLVPAQDLVSPLIHRGIRNVSVIGRGVDTQRFRPECADPQLRARWHVPEEGVVCLYVGRLAPEKNLEVVEHAFAEIARHIPGARMVWVGDGPSLPRLKATHPDHLFAGPQIGVALAAHYASADLFLFGSLSETWGNVLGEALASGLAVVTYHRAAGRELITQGENGLTVPPGDADAFIQAAVRVAGDTALRLDLRRKARESMLSHGWSTIAARFEAILQDALTGHPAAKKRAEVSVR